MNKLLWIVGLLGGVALVATANLQITAGVVLIAVSVSMLTKSGIKLEDIDDTVLAELKKLLNRE